MGWCVVGILAVVALAIPCVLRRPAGARPVYNPILGWAIGAGVLFAAISLVPLVAGATVRVVCITAAAEVVVALIGSAVAAGRHPDRALPYGLLVLIPALPLAGWAAITPTASVVTLAFVVLAARSRSLSAGWRRSGLRTPRSPVLRSRSSWPSLRSPPARRFGRGLRRGGIPCAAVLLFGAQARRGTAEGVALEVVGGYGILGGVLAASQSAAWVAGYAHGLGSVPARGEPASSSARSSTASPRDCRRSAPRGRGSRRPA